MQKLCDQFPLDYELRKDEIAIRQRTAFLEAAEKSFYSQKAKAIRLNMVDKGTKYFHSLAKSNSARNAIHFITKANGEVTYDMAEIVKLFEDYYTDLFGVTVPSQPIDYNVISNGTCLVDCEQASLVEPITNEEIKMALFDMASNKAPGPDGYPAAFFKEQWETVGTNVTAAVHEFFDTGLLLRKFNHTVVTLIPKTKHNPTVADFRPISCTNVVYKIITKILTKRMAPLLEKLIDKAQSAFIKGRNIMDNFFLAQELVRKYEKVFQLSPRCTIKIDLQKAYDTISWPFLDQVMRGLKFPPKFIHWVMTCVTSPTYCLAINGGTHGFIHGKRGLRQGDPMSPTLFLLCMEYLSRSLAKRAKELDFSFHPRCDLLNITHIAFADDLLLFCRGDARSVKILADALDDFSAKSGLKINKHKSSIFFGGVREFERNQILDILQFNVGEFPTKYLGLPLAAKRLNKIHYNPLVSQISDHINKWNNLCLSMAGRIELVRSVLQGVQCYWMQALPLPVGTIDRITSIVRKFVWGSKSCPVAWKDVCRPTEEGGLNLRDLTAWNKALLAKVLWNIHSKSDSLWIRWIHGEYLRGKTIWEIKCTPKDSATIKNILATRDRILADNGGCKDRAGAMLDKWFEGNGTSAAYDHLRSKGGKQFWHKFIWKGYVPPRWSISLWMALRGRLKTADRLDFVSAPKVCQLCRREPETHAHLFFQCRQSLIVWMRIRDWLKITRRMTSIPSAIKHIHKEKKRGSAIIQKGRLLGLAATVNHLWHARNLNVFEKVPFVIDRIVSDIKKDVYTVLYSLFPAEKVVEHLEHRV